MPIATNDALTRKRKKQRIVEEHTAKDYVIGGKKVNKNVYELQQIYETTQAKSTKILPEFIERIRFMIVQGIRKATFSKVVDQEGPLFSFVLEDLLHKVLPKHTITTTVVEELKENSLRVIGRKVIKTRDIYNNLVTTTTVTKEHKDETKLIVTTTVNHTPIKYNKTKTNLGNYILNSCYWSVIQYNNDEKWFENQVSCGDFLEDYEKASLSASDLELGHLKFISHYEPGNTYMPILHDIIQGAPNAN